MSERRIVIAGAGGHFTPGLINDIVTCEGLRGSTVILFDLNAERLDIMTRFCRKVVEESKTHLKIESETKMDEALANADFVICTIRVGGFEGTKLDLEIPWHYGIAQTVGDTMGPGGLSYGLRNVWATVEICRELEHLSPKAWVINFTNPMSAIGLAISRHTKIRAVGLCHGIFGTMESLSKLFKVERSDLYGFAAGINHLTWIMDLRLNEKDAYPLLKERLRQTKVGTPIHDPSLPSNLGPVTRELFAIFGLLPSPGDVHISEFFPWYLSKEVNYGEAYGLVRRTEGLSAEYREREEMDRKIIAQIEGKAPIRIRQSGESAVGIINSIANNERTMYDAVNILNNGCISNILEEGNVEVPAMVDGRGIHGITCGKLPFAIVAHLNHIIMEQILIADAAVKGDRNLALQALLMDPLMRTVEQATSMLNEMLKVHAPYLPQFKQ